MDTTEIIGLSASVLVLVSFLMKRIRVIRLVNIFAAVTFVVYGIIIEALSIWLLNGMLVFVHLFFLLYGAHIKKKEKFRLLKTAFPNKSALRKLPLFYYCDVDFSDDKQEVSFPNNAAVNNELSGNFIRQNVPYSISYVTNKNPAVQQEKTEN